MVLLSPPRWIENSRIRIFPWNLLGSQEFFLWLFWGSVDISWWFFFYSESLLLRLRLPDNLARVSSWVWVGGVLFFRQKNRHDSTLFLSIQPISLGFRLSLYGTVRPPPPGRLPESAPLGSHCLTPHGDCDHPISSHHRSDRSHPSQFSPVEASGGLEFVQPPESATQPACWIIPLPHENPVSKWVGKTPKNLYPLCIHSANRTDETPERIYPVENIGELSTWFGPRVFFLCSFFSPWTGDSIISEILLLRKVRFFSGHHFQSHSGWFSAPKHRRSAVWSDCFACGVFFFWSGGKDLIDGCSETIGVWLIFVKMANMFSPSQQLTGIVCQEKNNISPP